MTIHVLAEIRPLPEAFDAVVDVLGELVAETRKEDGCLAYDLFASEDGETLHFVERWEDDATLAAHMAAPHFKAVSSKLAGKLAAAPNIRKLKPIGTLSGDTA